LEFDREALGKPAIGEYKLSPHHILLGIERLRENNISDGEYETSNPIANMMNMFRSNDNAKKSKKITKTQETTKISKITIRQ
jgi:hypothetical protein